MPNSLHSNLSCLCISLDTQHASCNLRRLLCAKQPENIKCILIA